MSVNKNGSLRPDGFSASVPLGPFGIGGTYYWNPGSPTAPSLTLTGGLGIGGGGLHSIFLRKGMTSGDTLGYGANANVWMLPSVGVNASIPDNNGIPEPWKAKVSSVEAGVGLPGFSGNYTATPRQIADFLAKYVLPPPSGPDGKSAFVRDSAAATGVPSRNNVFEYGFPELPAQPSMGLDGTSANTSRSSVFDMGAPPISFVPRVLQNSSAGIPTAVDLLNPDAPPLGGLAALLSEYMRSPSASNN